MKIDEITQKTWKYESTRRMTYQKVRLYYLGLTRGLQEKIGAAGNTLLLYRNVNGNFLQWHDDAGLDELKGFIESVLLGDTSNRRLPALSKSIERDFAEYVKKMKRLRRNYERYSNEILIRFLRKFYDLDRKVEGAYWIVFNHFDEVLTETIRKILKHDYVLTDGEIEKQFRSLSQPHSMIPLDRERLSLLKIALLPEKKQPQILQKHHEEFTYMPMYDINYEPYSLKYFEDELAQILRSKTKEEIKLEMSKLEQKYRHSETEKFTARYHTNQKLHNLLEFYRHFSFLKEQKPYTRDKGNYYIKPLFEELARRTKLSLDDILFLTTEEIQDILFGKSTLSRKEMKRRATSSVFYGADGVINVITDPDELNKIDKILTDAHTTELKGLGVNPGKVIAPVSIVLSNRDFKSFKSGNVMVASATRPDYLPLMKKAAAVVTNEGGMLSHAAIVSREFGIPCVVGTKNATQIFENGDMVEVDADKGTVRKI